MIKYILTGLLVSLALPAHAIDPLCVNTPNLSIPKCPSNSTDWFDSYTSIVDNLDILGGLSQAATVFVNAPITGDGSALDPLKIDISTFNWGVTAISTGSNDGGLQIAGNVLAVSSVTASAFFGNGSGITNLSPSAVGRFKAIQASSQVVINSTVFVATDLSIPLEANTNYFFASAISGISASNTPEMDFQFTVPIGSTITFNCSGAEGNGSFHGELYDTAGERLSINMNAGIAVTLTCNGTIEIDASSGNIAFNFAQTVANANPTTLNRAGHMIVWKE